jgi:hypothetical protein
MIGPNPPGRLPAAMLRALAAELSDPGRFSRAKAYARDGAVIDIDISRGEVRATIQGSRYEPYVASVYVTPSDDHDSLLGLIPDRDELQATCSCPDDGPYGGAFCKHALAALLTLADEVTIEPGALAQWRTADPDAEASAIPRRRVDGPGSRPGNAADADVVDVLVTAVAAPAPIPGPPDLPARLPVTMAARGGPHGEDVARVLADALAVLRSH